MPHKRKTKRRYGDGSVYKKHRAFSIAWREGGVRRYDHGFRTEEDARAALARIVSSIDQGLPGAPPQAPEAALVARLGDLVAPWLERRKLTHRSYRDDSSRWKNHLAPAFGHLRPGEIDTSRIRTFVEGKRAHLDPDTIKKCVALLSTIFSQLAEDGVVKHDPVKKLPATLRRLMRSTHDPRRTPFLHALDDVRRVYLALPTPINVCYAVCAFGGLRPGEALALTWEDVDFERRLVYVRRQVQRQKITVLKDDESRDVPIQNAAMPVLQAYKRQTGGVGYLFPPRFARRGGRPGAPATFTLQSTLNKNLRKALAACELPAMTWYEASKHTFASQWVMANGSMAKLAQILGHSNAHVTERYSHLRPDLFADADFHTLRIKLAPAPRGAAKQAATGSGRRVQRPPAAAEGGAIGYRLATEGADLALDGKNEST